MEYFGNLYKKQELTDIVGQMDYINEFPNMFSQEELLNLKKKVSSKEVKMVLKSFALDKSLGLDGWTPNFFLHFFDNFSKELTDMVN